MKTLCVLLLLTSCAIKGNKEIHALKSMEASTSRRGSEPVPFKKLVIFSCENIPGNRYLMNERYTNMCWIENPGDLTLIIKGIGGGPYTGPDTIYVKECPLGMTVYKACNPASLRKF